MKNLEKKVEACIAYGSIAINSYAYKMGGITEVVIQSKGAVLFSQTYDRREYYSGRGAKYNKNVRHDYIVRKYNIAQLNRMYKEAYQWQKTVKKQNAEAMVEAKLLKKLDFATLEKHLLKSLTIIQGNEYVGDERYWLNGYFGCGVYRLFFVTGKVAATLKGGYGQSIPYNRFYQFSYGAWVQFVNGYVKSKLSNNVVSAKADGSGTYFYLREEAFAIGDDNFLLSESQSIETNNYTVPNVNGGMHLNLEVI